MKTRIAFALIEQGRAIEWVTSMVLLCLAVTLSFPGDSLQGTDYLVFKSVGVDEASLAVPLAILACIRLVALYVNGSWRRTPVMRMIGACGGASVFSIMALAFLWPFVTGQTTALSTGVMTYAALAISDLGAAYRSAADVRVANSIPRA